MVLTMIRVRLAVRQATIGERFAYRYGETLAPLDAGVHFVRWDNGETSYVDGPLLEARSWTEERCVASVHADGLWGCGCSECRLLQVQARDQGRHDGADEEY